MPVATARITVHLLMALLVTFIAACPTLDATGTGNKHQVTATRSPLDVASAHVSSPTTADDASPRDDGKRQGGSANRKQKYSEVEDADWSWSAAGSPPWLSNGKEGTGSGRPTRQRRYADWTNRKQHHGRPVRSSRDMVAVGWSKRPRYYREDGANRNWRTNMIRVWGKRSGPMISGSARMTPLF